MKTKISQQVKVLCHRSIMGSLFIYNVTINGEKFHKGFHSPTTDAKVRLDARNTFAPGNSEESHWLSGWGFECPTMWNFFSLEKRLKKQPVLLWERQIG